ncbi:MAG TPA: O-antigen ligase family protein [Gemmatimonadales bacterium]|nr:O-antigen ligase family protein [Gemmatimonadales bacterium]
MKRPAAAVVLALTLTGIALAAVPVARFSLDRFGLAKELVLVAGAALAAALRLGAARRLRADAADGLLAATLALAAVSALGAESPWLAVRALALLGAGIAAFEAARGARALLAPVALAVVLAALPAVLTAWGALPDWADGRRAPAGTFGNRNFLAHLLVVGLPALALVTARTRRRAAGLAWSAGLACVSAALVLTRTRAAWVAGIAALVAAVAALLVLRRANRAGPASIVAGAGRVALPVIAGVVLAVALPNRLRWHSPTPYRDTLRRLVDAREGSGRGRVIQARTTLRLVGEHPLLGVGPGNWMVAYPRYAASDDPSYDPGSPVPTNRVANADWTGLAAELGVPALVALVAAGLVLLTGAGRRLRTGEGEAGAGEAGEAVVVVATVAALAVAGALDAVLQRPGPLLVGAVVLGALGPRTRARVEWRLPRSVAAVLAALVLAAGLGAASLVARSIAAGAIYATDRRAPALERAADVAPAEYRLQYLAAQYWTYQGDCARAERFVARARGLLPSAPALGMLEERCAGRP